MQATAAAAKKGPGAYCQRHLGCLYTLAAAHAGSALLLLSFLLLLLLSFLQRQQQFLGPRHDR